MNKDIYIITILINSMFHAVKSYVNDNMHRFDIINATDLIAQIPMKPFTSYEFDAAIFYTLLYATFHMYWVRAVSKKFAISATSLCHTLHFLAVEDVSISVGYYVFDLINLIFTKSRAFNSLFIAHHLGTLYAIMLAHDHPDFQTIHTSLIVLKYGDICLEFPKLVLESAAYAKLYTASDALANIAVALLYAAAVLTWLPYKIMLPVAFYPLKCDAIFVIGLVIHIMNTVWFFKLISTTCGYIKKIFTTPNNLDYIIDINDKNK